MRLLLPLLAANIALAHLATAAPPKELKRPPVGDDIPVQVMRGGSAAVELRAYEGRNVPLSYEIVQEPSRGKLSGFRQADPNRQGFAAIVYTHGDDESSYEDEFAFRARALVGGGVSRPIKVKVRVVDAPPKLAAPRRVEFAAAAGESDMQSIGLTNAGGAVLEGRLQPKEPFTAEDGGYFRLRRGESTNVAVRFSPKSAAPVATQRIFPAPADPPATIVLEGNAKEPFAASASAIEVQTDGSRTGELVVTNLATSALELAVKMEPQDVAEIPGKVEVPRAGTAAIPVRIGPEKKGGPVALTARVSNAFHACELPMAAPAVPPCLAVLTPQLDLREESEAELRVENSGGMEARFTVDVPGSVELLEGASSFAVPAGGSTTVRLRRGATATGLSALTVGLGQGEQISVPVFLPEPAPSATPAAIPAPSPPPPKWQWELNKDVRLQADEEKSVRIAWLAGKPGWTNAVLQLVGANGPQTYAPEPERKGWWEGVKAWWSGKSGEPVVGARTSYRESTKSSTDAGLASPGEKWRTLTIAEEDMHGADLRWCIAAAAADTGSQASVSQTFRMDRLKNSLIAADEASAPATAGEGSGEAPVLIVRRQNEDAALLLTLALVGTGDASGYAVERVTGLHVSKSGAGTGAVYDTERMPESAAKIVSEGSMVSSRGKLHSVTVRFENLGRGSSMLCRLVPASTGGNGKPSAPFMVAGPPARKFPWTVFLSAAAIAIAAWMVWSRIKRSR